jgi:Ca2+-binding RTX toxin-like protein
MITDSINQEITSSENTNLTPDVLDSPPVTPNVDEPNATDPTLNADGGARVGFYDMSFGQGNPNQEAPILAAGFEPVNIANLSSEELAEIDVLFVQNPDNGSYGGEYLANLDNIEQAVDSGLTLIIHDRFVDDAEAILPSSENFDIRRDFSDDANIDVRNPSSDLIEGPGGVITDTNLDGGTSSSHGFAVDGTLPGDADLALSRSNPSEIVTFSYEVGSGNVVYSSIPLDFYLDGFGPFENFSNIYAPNVVEYGVELIDLTPSEIIGTEGDDVLTGTNRRDLISGLGGDDIIQGLAGNDQLFGGDGNDLIAAGDGNDTVEGNAGRDDIVGGDGNDLLEGGAGVDRILGESGNDTISGGRGNDILDGGEGNDSVSGDEGSDRIFGGSGEDSLSGGAGADTLTGGFGNDSLDGGEGDDRLIGIDPFSPGAEVGFGAGEVDTLTGAVGRDTFVLADENRVYYDDGEPLSRGESDFALITDFDPSQDFIQLKGEADVYSLDFFTSELGTIDADLIFDPGVTARGEVIATLQDVSTELSVSDPAFVFV